MMFLMVQGFGAENDYYVKIRVRNPRQFNEQAELDGFGAITVYNIKNNVVTPLFQLNDELSILIDSYYDSKYLYLTENIDTAVIGPYHIKLIDKNYSSYDEAYEETLNLKEETGMHFYPFFNGIDYEILTGTFKNANVASNELSNCGLNGQVVNGNNQNVAVYDEHNNIVFMYSKNYNIYFSSYSSSLDKDAIKIDNKTYKGMIGFYIIDECKLISINYVDLENYLYGVVPNEISASWPIESIKAQAVAARTYAVSHLGTRSYYGYDMEDSQDSQVYRGYSSENPTSNRAVDETKGEMIYYNGKLIDAFYHSTSGGRTENSEDIWYEAVPYLRGVEDEYSNISPYTEWQKVATKGYIIDKLREDGHNVGDLYDIQLTDISENYRVKECIFVTDIGKITYKKENIRRVLGYNFLLSSWFTIDKGINSKYYFITEDNIINDTDKSGGIIGSILDTEVPLESGSLSNKYIISSSGTSKLNVNNIAFRDSKGVVKPNIDNSNYTFNGRGWGHGIGMSQYGARQMAAEGFTYKEILKHYYTGVNIQ